MRKTPSRDPSTQCVNNENIMRAVDERIGAETFEGRYKETTPFRMGHIKPYESKQLIEVSQARSHVGAGDPQPFSCQQTLKWIHTSRYKSRVLA